MHILLKHHFISTLYYSDIFQSLESYPQGEWLIHFSSMVNKLSHQMQNSF